MVSLFVPAGATLPVYKNLEEAYQGAYYRHSAMCPIFHDF